jgi:hypothetical protein
VPLGRAEIGRPTPAPVRVTSVVAALAIARGRSVQGEAGDLPRAAAACDPRVPSGVPKRLPLTISAPARRRPHSVVRPRGGARRVGRAGEAERDGEE